jgi:hypothetical protein
MDTRYEESHPESHPRSPFALNVITVIVYIAAAVVVTFWLAMVLGQAEKF